MIISNKHGMYELPHKLPNELRLKIFQNFIELLPSPTHEMKTLPLLVKISFKTETKLFP